MRHGKKNYIWWYDPEEVEHKEKCKRKGCNKKGEYKAPISANKTGQYQFFCLDHIIEFNKNWNFFDGMDEQQLHFELEKQFYQGESWPFGVQKNAFHHFYQPHMKQTYDPFEIFSRQANTAPAFPLTSDDNKALALLELDMPFTAEALKKNYRRLARLYHPDSQNSKADEDMLKSINEAYGIAKKLLIRYEETSKALKRSSA